jgi:hypothetical protein
MSPEVLPVSGAVASQRLTICANTSANVDPGRPLSLLIIIILLCFLSIGVHSLHSSSMMMMKLMSHDVRLVAGYINDDDFIM